MQFTFNVALCLAVATSAEAAAASMRTRLRFWGKPASEEEDKSSTTAVIFWLVAVSSTIAVIFGLVAVGALYLIKAQQKKQRCVCLCIERECVCMRQR